MCGFVGIWNSYESSIDERKANLKKMIIPLTHRGPDDIGFWAKDSKSPGLAHRRLSIQDLSYSGHQPMVSTSGRYVMVFNGEIYNHFEIRNEINNLDNSSISWNGKSDTETLLKAIDYWPIEEVLNKVVGMFAFAVWDRKDRNLILARDRFGEKPLYYGLLKEKKFINKKNLFFGSELSAFKALNSNLLKINPLATNYFFKYGYIPDPISIYDGIKKLSPGNLIKIKCDQDNGCCPHIIPEEIQWYKRVETANRLFNSQRKNFNSKEILQNLENTLALAIKNQTISDVPLGTFLSGGIDSSLITALLQTQKKDPISSFTISFPDDEFGLNQGFNEGPYANKVAKCLGTNHTEIKLTYNDARNLIPNLSKVFSEPFADSSQIPTLLVCGEAKKAGLSVMLSGDGGDEFFGGYNRHKIAPLLLRGLSRFPSSIRNYLAKSLNYFPDQKTGLNQDKKEKLARAIKSADNFNSLYNSLISFYTGSSNPLIQNLEIDNSACFGSISNSLTLSEQFMLRDVINYLPSDLLVKIDRTSMSVSLETRAPFLDHRVAEMAWSLPLSFKIKRNGYKYTTKWALREILKKYLPQEIINRPKAGFAIPIGKWLKGPLKSWAEDLIDPILISKQGYLNSDKVAKLWSQHLLNQNDNTSKIWTILMWQSWLNEWE